MKIPIVLPVVHVHAEDAGTLSIDVNGKPYDAGRELRRPDLQRLLDTITAELDSPIRVEITEVDGTTYADIATPPSEPTDKPPDQRPATEAVGAGLSGSGFQPGEQVAVAYVLLRQTADADGATVVHLPAAAIAGRGGSLLLFGLDSKASALLESPA